MRCQHVIVFIVLFIFPSLGSSQIIKGTILPGGEARMNWTRTETDEYLFVQVIPSLGYMLTDQLMLGGALGGGVLFNEINAYNTFASVFGRYYLPSTSYPTQWFVGTSATFTSFKESPQFIALRTSEIYPHVGLDHFFAPSIALDVRAGPAFRWQDELSRLNLSAQAGLRIFIDPDQFASRKSALPIFTPGHLLLGGTNISLNFNPGDGGEIAASFNPSVGIFLSRFVVLGVRADLAYRKDSFSPFKVTDYGFVPFIRYYANEGHISTFVEGGYGLFGQTLDGPATGAMSETGSFWRAGGGANIFITENAALELGLFYSVNDYTMVRRLGSSLGFQVFLN